MICPVCGCALYFSYAPEYVDCVDSSEWLDCVDCSAWADLFYVGSL